MHQMDGKTRNTLLFSSLKKKINCQVLNVAGVGRVSNSNLSFSLYETSHGDILGGANEK